MYHWRGRKFHCCVLFFGFAWVGFNVRSDRRNGALTFRHGCAGNNKITTLLRRMALRKRQKIAWARRHPDQLVRYRPRYCNLFAVIALVEYVGGLSTRRIAEVSIRGNCVCYHTQPTCSHCHDMLRQREVRVEARCSETFRHRQGLAAGADVFNTQSHVVRCPVHDIGPGVQKMPTCSARCATGTARHRVRIFDFLSAPK